MNKFIKDKYKNVTAISFTAYRNELIITFSGFEEEEDLQEFNEFVFRSISMPLSIGEDAPTIH